jgi:hypothetical protein
MTPSDQKIAGAFGTIAADDHGKRRGLRARLLTLFAIIGPGLIVMVGDNDAGGVSTYAQAGQNFGLSLLWVLPLLLPVLIINQEMVARLGVVTGIGHGKLIRERITRRWGNYSVAQILLLNFLIIVTEFIGVSLSMRYFGVSPYLSVPVATLTLFLVTASGSFRRWERFMMLFVGINLVTIPLVIMAHPRLGSVGHDVVVPSIRGGVNSSSVLLIISIIGTTIAPWQLYFQESNIVDKKISPRWLNYERADTVIGSLVVVIGAAGIIIVTAYGLSRFGGTNAYTDGLGVARGLARHLGHWSGDLFAILLLNASVIGAAAVTLASSYAISDVWGGSASLNTRVRDAKGFFGGFALMLLVAAAVTLAPRAPLGIIVLAVQAMCGLMLPSTTIFVVWLCNDRELLGPWVNKVWLNVVAVILVMVLCVLSVTMMVSTLFTSVHVVTVLTWLSLAAALALVVGVPMWLRARSPRESFEGDRRDWRTPRLSLVSPAVISRPKRWLLRANATYLAVAGSLLVVRVIQLIIH